MLTLGMVTIVVDGYDAAIAHYVNDLGFNREAPLITFLLEL